MTKATDLVVLKVKRPDEALFSRSKASLAAAQEYEIHAPEEAQDAGAILREIKGLSKELDEKRTAITGPINLALREINGLFKPAKEWLGQAEQVLKSKMLAYKAEQDRIARELQAKADALARKEREKLERRAAKADKKGMSDKAEVLRQVAETKTAPVIVSEAPKVAGIATRETWKAVVTNELKLIRHIAIERNDLLPLLTIDQQGLNAWARRLKDGLDLPGVEVKKETSIAARAQ